MPIAVTFLEDGKQPAAQTAALLAEFLNAATKSLHLAIYDFRLGDANAAPVVEALRGRAAAGVDVRIVYDRGKLEGDVSGRGDPAAPGTADFLRRVGDGVHVKPISGGDPKMPKLMHHKYVVRDGGTPAGAVWTGSTNFTDDSWTIQENNILRIDSPELCKYYETDFDELWQRGDITTTGAHDAGTVKVGSTTIHVAFSPGDGREIDSDVVHHIRAARRRIKVCSMLITSGGILGALRDALQHNAVPEFGGICDRVQMETPLAQWRDGPAAWKIDVFNFVAAPLAGKLSDPYTPTSRHNFMHNKVLVLDDAVVTGSYNLSHSAQDNAENLLVIQDKDLADRYGAYIDGLVRRYRTPQAY
jgi:phosphatidylserine/phosphatidylglycerophosphate/cardiolipin synthase-like enzyme